MRGTTKSQGQIAGADWLFETGRLAGQANGAVTVTLGDVVILATATANKNLREGQDFFPLTVDVEEKMYAIGKIPGSFFRREGRASEEAILLCRLTDRPLRPSFPEGFRNEVQVVLTILSADQKDQYDIVALNAASAALMVSGIPFDGPIAAVRMGLIDGEWVTNPTHQATEEGVFDLVVAGRLSDAGDVDIMMVEAGATEKAWSHIHDGGQPAPTEERIVDALEAAKPGIRESIELQRQLAEAVAPEALVFPLAVDHDDDVYARVEAIAGERLAAAVTIPAKRDRNSEVDAIKADVKEQLAEELGERAGQIGPALRSVEKNLVRRRVLDEGLRIDGRGPTDLRPLAAEVGFLPRVHGVGLFERGETQVLNVATLGMPRMARTMDTLGIADSKRYMHNYNMPPYSTGEASFMRGPKRREVGHGALAERALLPVIPSDEEFPYTLRVVSEAISSNGSTSMASVCSSSLSLMDAGVPIKAPVAGIAMGLVNEGDRFVSLTDILGAEDALGDMDFKVAGTGEFITAMQLDTKIQGLPADVLAEALQQAAEARRQIMAVMLDTLDGPREELRDAAPRMHMIEVPIDKIGDIIGPKGKIIQQITRETGADIDIDDEGIVRVGAADGEAAKAAMDWVDQIVNPPMAEIGGDYDGRVVNITSFGAFVNILPGRDGLLHISKIGGSRRIDRVEDVLNIGDKVKVRVDGIDQQGKITLLPISGPEGLVGDDGAQAEGGRSDAPPRRESRDRGERRSGRGRGDRDRGERTDRSAEPESSSREGGGEPSDSDRDDRDKGEGSRRRRRRRGGRDRSRDSDRGERSTRQSDTGQSDTGQSDSGQSQKPRRESVSFEDEFEKGND